MTTERLHPIDQKKAEMDAVLAEMSAAQDAIQKARDEYDALRIKAKTDEPGIWRSGKNERRLWELSDEIERYSREGFARNQRYLRLAQEWTDMRRSLQLSTLLEARLI